MPAEVSWTSLAPQRLVARRLFGREGGAKLVDAWLAAQLGRVDDPAFARLFSDHIDLPGIEPADYNHRLIEARGLRLLGGIRFFGGDVERPFVEVVAWSGAGAPEIWPALRRIVADAWTEFRPNALRVLVTPDTPLPADAASDMTVHAAPCGRMAPDDGRVRLEPFADAAEAVALVRARYGVLARTDPDLARGVQAATPFEIKAWHARGTLFAIRRDGRTVGMIAVEDGAVEWLQGRVVTEEVVAAAFAGSGLATAVQRALAARLAVVEPDTLLLGTILERNRASYATAIRAGRPVVMRYAFLPLS